MSAYLDRSNASYRAMICGGGSVLAERFDLASPEAATRWIRREAERLGRGVDYGTYRINLDDASWTRVSL